MSALAATSSCSACLTSGRRSSSDAGSPGGMPAAAAVVEREGSRVIGPEAVRAATTARSRRRAICRSMSGNRGRGLRAVGLDAVQLEPVRDAAVQAVLEIR